MSNQDRRANDKDAKMPTIISGGSSFSGSIKGRSPVIVMGSVIGNCEIDNALNLEATGEWTGDIQAESVVINGRVEGNVIAKGKLEVGATGNIQGNVVAATLAIASGAQIDGDIKMASEGEPVYFEEKRKT